MQQKHRAALCALFLAVCLLFSGCGMTGTIDVNDLLRAPQSSGETAAVQKALNSYLGESAQLKYPTSGDNLTPFQFGDWNGDGAEEAAVLYTSSAKGQNVFLAVLEQKNGAWQVTQEVEGLATAVESVSYAAMQDSPAVQLVVGYINSQGAKYLAIYSYQNETLEEWLRQSYSQMLLADITGSGAEDLVLVCPEDEQGLVQLQLVTNQDGQFTRTQQLPVGQDSYTGCAGIHAGKGTDGTPYLVVDGKVGSYLASTILIYDNRTAQLSIYLPAGLTAADMSSATLRYNGALLSRDLNGDGTIDIPAEVADGGSASLLLERRLSLVVWRDFTGGDMGNSQFGVVDQEYNYFLPLPQSWYGSILLDVNDAGTGWCIRNQMGQLLLDARVVDPAKTSAGGYVRVATIGNQQVQLMPGASLSKSIRELLENGVIVL